MKTLKEKTRSVINRLVSIENDPRKIALGYALGIFLTTTPFIGLKAPIAIVICQWFKWKKVAAIIGVFHVNTITGPFYYGLSFLLGKAVMGYDCSFNFHDISGFQAILVFYAGSKEVFVSLLIGGLIIGIPLSVLAYKLAFILIRKRKGINPTIRFLHKPHDHFFRA